MVKRGVFRRLYEGVVELLGKPETPGAFYRGMRLMAIDGFVLDLPECPPSQRGRRRWHRDLIDEISKEIIEPRRNRINPRVIKKKMSKWKKKQPEHRRYPQPHKEFREALVMLD